MQLNSLKFPDVFLSHLQKIALRLSVTPVVWPRPSLSGPKSVVFSPVLKDHLNYVFQTFTQRDPNLKHEWSETAKFFIFLKQKSLEILFIKVVQVAKSI